MEDFAAIDDAYGKIAVDEFHHPSGWYRMYMAPTDGTPVLLYARAITATAAIRVIGMYYPDVGWCALSFSGPPTKLMSYLWAPLQNWPYADPRAQKLLLGRKRAALPEVIVCEEVTPC